MEMVIVLARDPNAFLVMLSIQVFIGWIKPASQTKGKQVNDSVVVVGENSAKTMEKLGRAVQTTIITANHHHHRADADVDETLFGHPHTHTHHSYGNSQAPAMLMTSSIRMNWIEKSEPTIQPSGPTNQPIPYTSSFGLITINLTWLWFDFPAIATPCLLCVLDWSNWSLIGGGQPLPREEKEA